MLSLSPGGGAAPNDGHWVADNKIASMYRIVTDFHGGWYGWGGLQQLIMIVGNFTASKLLGANLTWPDPDMIPLSGSWWETDATVEEQPALFRDTLASIATRHDTTILTLEESNRDLLFGTNSSSYVFSRGERVRIPIASNSVEQADRGQTIASLWMVAKAPLFVGGTIPSDNVTLQYLTNKVAMEVHSSGTSTRVVGYTGNCTCDGGTSGSCTICQPSVGPPCVVVFASDVTNSDSRWTAVLIINLGEDKAERTIPFQSLGLSSTDKYSISNVWDGQGIGSFENNFTVKGLRPHASLLYKLVQS